MATSNVVRPQDLYSVGSRIRWGAILAGVAVALAMQFLLGSLMAAVAGARYDTTDGATWIWMFAIGCVTLFAGGVVATQLTDGENKVEAVLYGIVMWATVTVVIAHTGATAGQSALAWAENRSSDWGVSARAAGVPADQVEQWRTKLDGQPEISSGAHETDRGCTHSDQPLRTQAVQFLFDAVRGAATDEAEARLSSLAAAAPCISALQAVRLAAEDLPLAFDKAATIHSQTANETRTLFAESGIVGFAESARVNADGVELLGFILDRHRDVQQPPPLLTFRVRPVSSPKCIGRPRLIAHSSLCNSARKVASGTTPTCRFASSPSLKIKNVGIDEIW